MTTPQTLAELSAERRDALEHRVLADIGRARRTRSRRRGWLIASGAAAASLAVIVALPGIIGGGQTGAGLVGTADSAEFSPEGGGGVTDAIEPAPALPDGAADSPPRAGSAAQNESVPDGDRAIISSASVSVTVADVRAAAQQAGDIAADAGGYVENLTIGEGAPMPVEPLAERPDTSTMIVPGDGWLQMRVPATALTDVVDAVEDLGDVTASTVSRTDVTDQRIDLQARIEASEASVARLQELMAQAGSVGDLLDAEAQLAERQGTLEAYRQQFDMLQDQVEMATLSVQLSREHTPEVAEPGGFVDGVENGWGGLIATLNALVVAIGFLLPWLAVLAVLVLLVWLIRRARRAAGIRRLREESSAAADDERGSHTQDPGGS